jgi:hypothetical protein
MGQVEPPSEVPFKRRPGQAVPEKVHGPDRISEVPELRPRERWDLLGRKTFLPGRTEQAIFVARIDAGKLEKEVAEVRSDPGLAAKEGPDVHTDAHLDSMYRPTP